MTLSVSTKFSRIHPQLNGISPTEKEILSPLLKPNVPLLESYSWLDARAEQTERPTKCCDRRFLVDISVEIISRHGTVGEAGPYASLLSVTFRVTCVFACVSWTVSGTASYHLDGIFGTSEVFDADNGITIIYSALIIKLEVYGQVRKGLSSDQVGVSEKW